MPNWCATNYVVRGDKKELKEFCNLLNTMPNIKNGFGRYWMGNLVAYLKDWKTTKEVNEGNIGCRGTFNPNPEAGAYMGGPDVDENEEFSISPDGLFRFSTQSAWDRCEQVDALLKKHFPSLEFFWTKTDEFGGFHDIHDPENIAGFPRFIIDGDIAYNTFGKGEEDAFLEELKNICFETYCCPIPKEEFTIENLKTEEFQKKFYDWTRDKELNITLYYIIYEEMQ